MASSVTSDTELLTEHFGYPPVSLIDDIINSINILAERALNSVEQGLLNAPPATLGFKQDSQHSKQPSSAKEDDPAERAKTEIESGTHQLETLLCASIDRNFDKFELYVLRNILCVRPPDVRNYIRLSHYEGLDFSSVPRGSEGDAAHNDKPTIESVTKLRRKLRESMRLNALLHAEQERNARLLADLRSLMGLGPEVKAEGSSPARPAQDAQQQSGPLAFLHQQVSPLRDAGADTPLSTTAAFTLSQLQALRALSTSLRTMAPDLGPSPSGEDNEHDEDGKRSWRRERFEYVESATRRHLEAVQGLELGKDGEVRDGEWQGQGRKLGRDEVEGLERVVSVLGEENVAVSSPKITGEDRMDET